MPARKSKSSKGSSRPKASTVPKHVKDASQQLHKMESTIKSLLSPFADRLHLFIHPEQSAKRSKKKK